MKGMQSRFLFCLQMQVNLLNLYGNLKLIWKNWMVWENAGKIKVLDWEDGNKFWLDLSEGWKNHGFEKLGLHSNELIKEAWWPCG